MRATFDILQVAFWSISYILVICYSLRKKVIGIPVIALSANFAWETVAAFRDLTQYGGKHAAIFLWVIIDMIIVFVYLLRCKSLYFSKLIFVLLYAAELVLFSYIISLHKGLILLAFITDLTMAVEWLIYAFNKDYEPDLLSISSLAARLLGDMFAWLGYLDYHPLVPVIGALVLLLNVSGLVVIVRRKKGKLKGFVNGKPPVSTNKAV